MLLTPSQRRQRLDRAQVLLVFTPELAGADPLAALAGAIAHVDVVQVRPKPLGDRRSGVPSRATVTEARATYDWTQSVRELIDASDLTDPPLLVVNDRVDVARALADEGADGVHVGADDAPPDVAREVIGDDLLLGLSTHSLEDVVAALEAPVDMLGFGPVFPTPTKGYGAADAAIGAPSVVGPEAAWIAAGAAHVPVFPIGGIDLANADRLAAVGRAAIGSAILGADDPGAAAQAIRELITANG